MQPASKLSRTLGRILVAVVVAGGLLTAGATPGGAVSVVSLECVGTGEIDVTPGEESTDWALTGEGNCVGDRDSWTVSVDGVGTSDSLGLCTGDPTVTNLSIDVTLDLENNTPGRPDETRSQTWGAPQTTFPGTTPFLISEDGSTAGAGTMFTRIFLRCPGNDGSPAASFEWTMRV